MGLLHPRCPMPRLLHPRDLDSKPLYPAPGPLRIPRLPCPPRLPPCPPPHLLLRITWYLQPPLAPPPELVRRSRRRSESVLLLKRLAARLGPAQNIPPALNTEDDDIDWNDRSYYDEDEDGDLSENELLELDEENYDRDPNTNRGE